MHHSIHSTLRSTALFLLLGVISLGCNEAPTAPLAGEADTRAELGIQAEGTKSDDLVASAKPSSPVSEWHAATDFLCPSGPSACPAIARADNGHTIEIRQDNGAGATFGGGTLSVHPKTVGGSGTFVHRDAVGTALATGTWTATKLLSYKDWGPSPFFCEGDFPPEFCGFHAGRALIRVHLVADSGAEFDGILRVTCRLPEVKFPTSYKEGLTLYLEGGLDFNKEVSGSTVFVE